MHNELVGLLLKAVPSLDNLLSKRRSFHNSSLAKHQVHQSRLIRLREVAALLAPQHRLVDLCQRCPQGGIG